MAIATNYLLTDAFDRASGNGAISRARPLKLVVHNQLVPKPLTGSINYFWQQLARADRFAKLGEPERAVSEYDAFIEMQGRTILGEPGLRPLVAHAYHNKGVALVELGREEDALYTFSDLLDKFGQFCVDQSVPVPLLTGASNSIGEILRRLNRLEDAIKVNDFVMNLFCKPSLDRPQFREQVASEIFNKGYSLHEMGRLEDAISVYHQVVAYYDAFSFFGCEDKASQRFREYVALSLFNKALAFSGLNKVEEAIATYNDLDNRFTDKEATDTLFEKHIARALYNKGLAVYWTRKERADAVYNEIISRFSTSDQYEVQLQVANALLSKAGLLYDSRAVELYDTIISRYEHSKEPVLLEIVASAYVRKGLVFEEAKRDPDAMKLYDRVIDLFGHSNDAAIQEQVLLARKSRQACFRKPWRGVFEGSLNGLLLEYLSRLSIDEYVKNKVVVVFNGYIRDIKDRNWTSSPYILFGDANPLEPPEGWKDVGDVPDVKVAIGAESADDPSILLDRYLEARGVPASARAELARKLGKLIEEAKVEVLLPESRQAVRDLREADLTEFETYAKAHLWDSNSTIAPSTYILQHFTEWLGRGLTLEHIVEIQPSLGAAYKEEIRHNNRKRIRELTRPHKLPAGTSRLTSRKLMAELSEEQKEAKRHQNRIDKQLSRQRHSKLPTPKR